jgi:tRNA nucleotidyltransferase (CCA-adding enzyme)
MTETEILNHELQVVDRLLERIPGCRPMSIGGRVRDTLWSPRQIRPAIKDTDIEVLGATHEQIVDALAGVYELDLVGKQFGVLKVKGHPIDISIPRTEKATGDGHKDFDVKLDPNLTPEQAAARRDFTINTVAIDWAASWKSGSCLHYSDPYNGLAHIQGRILHPTSAQFEEDPLRALRAMQFIARL